MTQIESNVPVPEVQKKVAKRARKPKATKEPSGAQSLIKALQFIALAQKPQGTNYQTHCLINRNWAVAFDGVLTIGTKIEEDVTACPKTVDLLAALQKCGPTVAISQLNDFVLSVRSDKFKASVECIDFASMPIVGPDAPTHAANDTLREGMAALAWLATEGAQDAFCAALLLQSGSIVGTNRHVLLEFWHGLELPCHLLIPKAAINALAKTDKKLVAIGFSDISCTFHFEDESFMRTSIFMDRYPHYQSIFDAGTALEVTPQPPDFYTALAAVSGFAESKFVFMCGDKMQSHQQAERGATYDIAGIPASMSFDSTYLKQLEPHFKNTKVDKTRIFFQNGVVRGAIMGGSHFGQ